MTLLEQPMQTPEYSMIPLSDDRLEEEISSRLTLDAMADEDPVLTLIMGPICSGKTTIRREKFAHGFVLVDAAQLFIDLGGTDLDFPSALEYQMEYIGAAVSSRAVDGRMNIVTELVGAEIGPVRELIDAMGSVGYRINIVGVNAELSACLEREESRTQDNVSAYFAEQFQMKWLLAAARGFKLNA